MRCVFAGGTNDTSRRTNSCGVTVKLTPFFGVYSYRPSSSRRSLDSATVPREPLQALPVVAMHGGVGVEREAVRDGHATSCSRNALHARTTAKPRVAAIAPGVITDRPRFESCSAK